jgi:hypothetical protein
MPAAVFDAANATIRIRIPRAVRPAGEGRKAMLFAGVLAALLLAVPLALDRDEASSWPMLLLPALLLALAFVGTDWVPLP